MNLDKNLLKKKQNLFSDLSKK